jgi:hypothetical protein
MMQRMNWDYDGTGLLGLPAKYWGVLTELFDEEQRRNEMRARG